jgi:hypothetical protein
VRPAIRLAAASLLIPASLVTTRAGAVDVPSVGGKPMLIDITNTTVVDYHFNNRDDAFAKIPTLVNDNYGEWLDRLNVQLSWWRLRFGVRLDTAVYFHQLDRAGIAALIADEKPSLDALKKTDPDAANLRTTKFYDELHSRYLRAIYPSKLFLGYGQPGLEITVGDFYAQLGRGLVFSVRKIDELAVDTTVRGIKVVADKELGPVHLGATLFGGQLNPLRVDETSGRRLNGTSSPLFFGFPRGGNLETYVDNDPAGKVITRTDLARPSYLEDSVVGGRLEAGIKHVTFAGNTAVLLRQSYAADNARCLADGKDATDTATTRTQGQCASQFPVFTTTDPSKEHNRVVNFSGSMNIPSILDHGDLYVEVAGQQMRAGQPLFTKDYHPNGAVQDLSGYAVYAAASVTGGPIAVSLEGKHYRNFFPLSANIDITTPGFGAPEYALVTYSQPPTADPIYTEIISGGAPNVCVTGGRGRVDFRFNREHSVYATLGRDSSWSEIPGSPLDAGCTIDPSHRTDTWDATVGADLGFEGGQTHLKALVGTRSTEYAATPLDAHGSPLSTWFYREGYVRYDLIKHLGGRFSLQMQGFHRHRYEPVTDVRQWTEGENYTALQWSPHLSAIFGYEYMAKDLCEPAHDATLSHPATPAKNVCHFLNGGLQWRSGGEGEGAAKVVNKLFDSVSVFVGQRRAALRCVSGVCRQFPPFEGARLEITSRF